MEPWPWVSMRKQIPACAVTFQRIIFGSLGEKG